MNLYEKAIAETPQCSTRWSILSQEQRLSEITNIVKTEKERFSVLEAIAAKEDGQVIFRFMEYVPVDLRGKLLLDLELEIKTQVDKGLTVWLEPLSDKSSLRKLRGIEVK